MFSHTTGIVFSEMLAYDPPTVPLLSASLSDGLPVRVSPPARGLRGGPHWNHYRLSKHYASVRSSSFF